MNEQTIGDYLETLSDRLPLYARQRQRILTETEAHLREAAEKLVQQGMNSAEVERAAIEQFGSVDEVINRFSQEAPFTFAPAPLMRLALCGSIGAIFVANIFAAAWFICFAALAFVFGWLQSVNTTDSIRAASVPDGLGVTVIMIPTLLVALVSYFHGGWVMRMLCPHQPMKGIKLVQRVIRTLAVATFALAVPLVTFGIIVVSEFSWSYRLMPASSPFQVIFLFPAAVAIYLHGRWLLRMLLSPTSANATRDFIALIVSLALTAYGGALIVMGLPIPSVHNNGYLGWAPVLVTAGTAILLQGAAGTMAAWWDTFQRRFVVAAFHADEAIAVNPESRAGHS